MDWPERVIQGKRASLHAKPIQKSQEADADRVSFPSWLPNADPFDEDRNIAKWRR